MRETADAQNNLLMERQKRAAYALNMCTVSVSQIIDYNDVNILDQEYDAILNNLNLEEMPKDEALLSVLKSLLDVIMHFKQSEEERRFVEKEYQQKMKNAIWNAVPNFGVILAGGNPLTMALSLANQVGIGYMNYRRNRETYGMEKDRQMWQLRRAAMEQFNYIRKELFSCAWRLAADYQFPDSYRLVEKQVTEYNRILLDPDVRRKYERLDAIQDSFEAYPPFWYFFGNAANSIANDPSVKLSDSARRSFREKALAHFEKFEQIEQNSILREDILSASCALEHVDLLLLEEPHDQEKVRGLLRKAVRMSGNAPDILQLCAVTCMKIGETDEAVKILRNLVNQDYNQVINAQLLSAVYVRSPDRYGADYELLADRVDPGYLFPLPEAHEDMKQLEARFESQRRETVRREVRTAVERFVQKNEVRWNAILSTFEEDKQYPEDFFWENDHAKDRRRSEAQRVFHGARLWDAYQKRLAGCAFEPAIRGILNEMIDALFELSVFSDRELQAKAEEEIRRNIREKREDIEAIHEAVSSGSFQLSDYLLSQRLTLNSITHTAVAMLLQAAEDAVRQAGLGEIAKIESGLISFCIRMGIETPEISIDSRDSGKREETGRFSPELFGYQAKARQKNADFRDEMARFVSGQASHIRILDGGAEILLKDSPRFAGYFCDCGLNGTPDLEAHSVMVVYDQSGERKDLIFTTDGIVNVHRGKIRHLTPYREAVLKDGRILLYKDQYCHKSVDLLALAQLIRKLGRKFTRDVEDHVEYIPGVLTVHLLLGWFRSRPEAMKEHTARAIVIPTKENLEHFGYFTDTELDVEKNIMQCYYNPEAGDILGMRIVRGEGIESKFQSLLWEHDGILMVGR